MKKITYKEMVEIMRNHNAELEKEGKDPRDSKDAIGAVVVIKAESFDKPYSLEERSYKTWSNNKAFISGMGGYSIFSNCLDEKDMGVRLDWYLVEEKGTAWEVDYCYMLED